LIVIKGLMPECAVRKAKCRETNNQRKTYAVLTKKGDAKGGQTSEARRM